MALNARSTSLAQLIQEGENDKQQGGGVPRAANIQAPGITRAPKGGGDPIGLANQVSEFTTGKGLQAHIQTGINTVKDTVTDLLNPIDIPSLTDVPASTVSNIAASEVSEATTGAASSVGSEAATSAGSEIASGAKDLIGGFFA